jgi:hypothetical protein
MFAYSPWYAAVVLAGFVVLFFIVRAARRASLTRAPEFNGANLTLAMDEAAGHLVVTRQGQAEVLRMPLGAVTWRLAYDYDSTPVRADQSSPKTGRATVYLTSFKLPRAFAEDHLTDGTHALYVLRKWTTDLGNAEAELAVGWLDQHAKRIAPDLKGHIEALNAQKRELAAAARRHLPEKPVVECDRGRIIEHYRYVAFLASGFVYGQSSADGLPVPVVRVHAGVGRKIDVVFPDSATAYGFELTAAEMDVLQGLQQKGVLHVAPPIPRGY